MQVNEPNAVSGRIILSLGNVKKGSEYRGSGTDTDEVVDARSARTTERKDCGKAEETARHWLHQETYLPAGHLADQPSPSPSPFWFQSLAFLFPNPLATFPYPVFPLRVNSSVADRPPRTFSFANDITDDRFKFLIAATSFPMVRWLAPSVRISLARTGIFFSLAIVADSGMVN